MAEEINKRKIIETEYKTDEEKWNQATATNSMFVSIEQDEMKTIKIINWNIDYVEKVFDGKAQRRWEFSANCIEEDGEKVDKIFNTSSKRLMEKLQVILKDKSKEIPVVLNILKVGEKFNTNYSVKEIKGN